MWITIAPGASPRTVPASCSGSLTSLPERSTERRWQFANTFTYAAFDTWGDHAFKIGSELSAIGINGFQPAGFDGSFTFRVNTPFDAADSSTYPTLYRRNSGDPFYVLNSRVYAVFLQDEWTPTPRVTMNVGVRWDYEDAIRVARDGDNIAPRLALAIDPSADGRTSIRGAYGLYYDAVLFQALVNTYRGSQVARLQVANPGYPDPFGPNPNRLGSAVNAGPERPTFRRSDQDAVHGADQRRREPSAVVALADGGSRLGSRAQSDSYARRELPGSQRSPSVSRSSTHRRFNVAVQLSTIVVEAALNPSAAVLIRKRWPSRVTL
jgi:hypothetical protein